MSVQLSHSIPRDFTFNSAGTRLDLVTQFQTQAVAAGWSVVSGGGTSHVVLDTATTPQGLKMRLDVNDPGSGNCVQFKIKDNTTLVGPTTFYLLPVGGAAFRLWINPYQFFYFISGIDLTRQRALVCGGAPWIPDFIKDTMVVPYAGWLHGNGTSDTDTNQLNTTFRKVVVCASVGNYSAIWNGAAFGAIALAQFGLLIQSGLSGGNIDDMWEDGTFTIFEPIVCWPGGGFTTPVRHGLLWDAVLGSKPLDSEVRRTFGDLTWRNITHQSNNRFSLMLIVPV